MAATSVQMGNSITRPETLSRQAYAAVRKAIRQSFILPGRFYSEQQIAEALEISRTPVREALIELAREGIIEKLPQRGFRVRAVSDKELTEVFELRELLETHVARRLATTATVQQVSELRRILDEQARVRKDPSAFLEFDEEFHLTMAGMLGLARTQQMLLSLRAITLIAGAAALADPKRISTVLNEHRAVAERIAAHDPAGAGKAIHEHIQRTRSAAAASLRSVQKSSDNGSSETTQSAAKTRTSKARSQGRTTVAVRERRSTSRKSSGDGRLTRILSS